MLHGSRSLVLQDENGQIHEAHSISAGLDYPGVGPELAYLAKTGRLEVRTATDDEALRGLLRGVPHRGHPPRAGDVARVRARARAGAELGKGKHLVINCSGRGDKDVATIAAKRHSGHGPRGEGMSGEIAAAFAKAKARGEGALVAYAMAGDPDLPRSVDVFAALVEGGADILEIGVAFSDPIADGPVIQASSERALKAGSHAPARAG